MRTVLRIFFASEGSNAAVVVLCLLSASLFEGLGLATLLPLLTIATGVGASDSPFAEVVHRLFAGVDPTATLGILLLAVVGAVVFKALLTLLAMRYVGYAVADVSTRHRARLVRQLLSVRWSYLVSNPLGRFIHALGAQAGQSGEAYRLAALFMALAIQTVVLVIMTYVISWRLATAALILGGLTAWASNFLVRKVRRAARQANQRSREMLSFLADTMANIKVVKAMARQDAFENLLERRIDQLRKSARKSVINRELMRNMQEITTAVCLGLAAFLAIGVWEVPVAELIVVGLLLSRTVQSLTKLQGQYQAAVVFESPYEELQMLLAEADEAVEPSGQRPAPRFERGCRLERVTFGYSTTPVLRDASLEIPANSLTVLTGPSGEGKTTIADLVIGLYAPQSGRITVDGVALDELDLRSWRRQIGYVPQEPILFHDTLMANLTLGDPAPTEDDVKDALRLAGAWPFLDALPYGLWTVVGERGAKLSGGQRQRVALARALVHRPRLLILDEVTSALDPETERAICANIRSLTREVAVLAITHRPALLEWADTVYRLERGAVRREAGRVVAA